MEFISTAFLGLVLLLSSFEARAQSSLPDAPMPTQKTLTTIAAESATITLGGEVFPAKADLTSQFLPSVPDQGNEGVCHVYSSVALAEAYCNVVSGRLKAGKPSLKFSEKYFVYRHLRSKLGFILQTGAFNGDLLSTDLDSGYADNNLRRMFNGSILTEDEFKTNDKLEKALAALKTTPLEVGDFARQANSILDSYFLDQIKDSKLEKKVSKNGGFYATSLDPDVKKCVASRPEPEHVPYTLKIAVSLLAQGTPFILTTTWAFKNKTTGSHAVVIDGYRFTDTLDEKIYPEHIEFHVRNSSETEDAWGTHAAAGEITYLSSFGLTELIYPHENADEIQTGL